jgi:hypothetical protein
MVTMRLDLKSISSRSLIGLTIVILLSSGLPMGSAHAANAENKTSSWPMIEGDQQGTRCSAYSAPNNSGQVIWTYSQDDSVRNIMILPPVTGPDGSLYFWKQSYYINSYPPGEMVQESSLCALDHNSKIEWERKISG